MPGQDGMEQRCHVVGMQELIPMQILWCAVGDIVLRLRVVRRAQSCLDLCIKLPGGTLHIRA